MNCGIIGLPNVGKTALFNLLTENKAESSNYPYCTIEPNNGIAELKDPRFNNLSKIAKQARIVYPKIMFTDVAGLPPGASEGAGLGNQFLSNIRSSYALLHIVRAFVSPQVSRFDNKESTPQKDIELLEAELYLSDLEICERRLKEDPKSEYWLKTKKNLQQQKPPQQDEEGLLLTAKPQIIVVNITTGTEKPDIKGENVIYIDVDFQKELLGMEEQERRQFTEDMPGWESDINDIIYRVKNMLGLITFFTVVGGNEIKGYNVKRGTSAYEAAGKIHTDMKKNFIKAKCFNYNDLENEDFSLSRLREKGKIRTEGKDYKVKEGDILEIMFG
ncbi:MAG: DUF933 domain-containing protein [Elusimicrobiota bacterium]